MKSIPVVAVDPVRDDVQAAYDYFDEQLAGGGDAFLTHYFAIVDRIALNPEIFPLKLSDYRRALVPREQHRRVLLHRASACRHCRRRRRTPKPSSDSASRPKTW